MARFLIDELATQGSSVSWPIVAMMPCSHAPGLPDEDVLAIAHAEDRVLITDDKDFGELVFRHGRPHKGVIFFRLRDTKLATRARRLEWVLQLHSHELDQFLVVTGNAIR